MIAPEKFKGSQLRSGVFFGWGVRLALTGSVLVVMYFFLVAQSPLHDLGDTLRWAVPAGVACWILAMGLFALGIVAWNAEEAGLSGFRSARNAMVREPVSEQGGLLRDSLTAAALAIQKRFPETFHLEWSLPLLCSLDGRAFRDLGASFFREIGFRPITAAESGTTGVDIWLYGEDEAGAMGAVRCLPWGCDSIGIRQVREFFDLMTDEKIENGVLLTTGTFTEGAVAFAIGKKLELISGQDFLEKLSGLPARTAEELLRQATG